MKLTRLEILDFKRISAVAIDADTGNPIVLTGDNGQGKSSCLDAIEWALTRGGADRPIRNGAESATVALTLSDGISRTYTVKRKAKGANAYLDITAEDGSKMPSPQKFLDGLVGSLAFDPEAFTRLKPKEQADALRIAVGLDTSDLDDAYKTAYAQRTEANRAKDNAEKLFKGCPVVAGTPREKQNAADLITDRDKLIAELKTAEAANELLQETGDAIVETQQLIMELEVKLQTATARLAKLQQDSTQQEASYTTRKAATADHEQKIEAITTAIRNIDGVNSEIDAHNRALEDRKAKEDAYRATLKRYTDLDAEVKRVQAEKETRIAAAKFPVPGLAIEDDAVLVNDVPFSDLNTAERIKVSCLIAMSQNPALKVIFVREGALVSRANLAVLADLAEKHGMQVFIEVFSETPHDDSLHIEDGAITHINGQPADAQQLQLV
jgi:DNA repair exonuclease SbcCD ATPase subunit